MTVMVLPQSFLKLSIKIQNHKPIDSIDFVNTSLFSSFLTTIQSLGATVVNEKGQVANIRHVDAFGLFFNIERQMEAKFMSQVFLFIYSQLLARTCLERIQKESDRPDPSHSNNGC